MVARLSFVVASSLFVCSGAFAPIMMLTSGKSVSVGRGSFSASTSVKPFATFGLRMSEGSKDAASAREIDFSKVGFNDGSESGFSGMIFRPEESEEPESRCRVDWDVKCEKVGQYLWQYGFA